MKIAAVQMNSGVDKEKNLKTAERLIRKAAKHGAELAALPEVFHYRSADKQHRVISEPLSGQSLLHMRKLAQELKIWILAGSILEKINQHKSYNTSVLINPKGKIVSIYRKIHLFDSNVKDAMVKESKRIRAGQKPVIAKIGKYKAGLSVCYDLRFPELYRIYAKRGVHKIFVPSSFSDRTGEAHWETLLRARAVENQVYVIAPAQFGVGSNGVMTHGRSMIIDPWGRILAEAPRDKETIIYATIDLKEIKEIRKALPVLHHRRL